MGIRIVPKEELGQERLKEKGIGFIPPVLFPNLKNLYQRRAERLKELGIGEHPFADYLNFAAEVATAQNNAQHDNPLEMDMEAVLARATATNTPPLDAKTFPRTAHWHKLLTSIIAELMPIVPDSVRTALENLEKASEAELEEMATALLNEQFEKSLRINRCLSGRHCLCIGRRWQQIFQVKRELNMATIVIFALYATACQYRALSKLVQLKAYVICTARCVKQSGTWSV